MPCCLFGEMRRCNRPKSSKAPASKMESSRPASRKKKPSKTGPRKLDFTRSLESGNRVAQLRQALTQRPALPGRTHRVQAAERRAGRRDEAALERGMRCPWRAGEPREQKVKLQKAIRENQVGWQGAEVLGRQYSPAESGGRMEDSPQPQAPVRRTNRRME